jgi:hypothetical protein
MAEETREQVEGRVGGRVWNTQELQEDFAVEAFAAPYVVVRSKATGKRGTLQFEHWPRWYYGFREDC